MVNGMQGLLINDTIGGKGSAKPATLTALTGTRSEPECHPSLGASDSENRNTSGQDRDNRNNSDNGK